MVRSVQLPAPGRGAYDRSLTRAERDAEHRERLLLAAAEVLAEGPLTITRIVERAGVGRSTFYEFFDSPEHALEQLEQRTVRALESAFDDAFAEARTPLERVRAVARAWIEALDAQPREALSTLTRRPGRQLLSAAGESLQRALQRCVDEAGGVGWFRATDELSVLAAVAAAEALTRRHLTFARLREPARVLADIMLKLLL